MVTTIITPALALEKRCGWYINPTPGNIWLKDKDGEWAISVQGGYEADGDGPYIKDSQMVHTNGSHGYGCSCMDVETKIEDGEKYITKIHNAKALPLASCRKDKTLPKEECKKISSMQSDFGKGKTFVCNDFDE